VITTPWTLAETPSGTVTVIAARLPLRSLGSLPATLVWTWRLRRALCDAPGLGGYAFAMPISGSALWMVSAWTSRRALTAFQHNAAHRAAQADLRIRWAEVQRRILAAPDPAISPARWDAGLGEPGHSTPTEETR
jgi:hypothetical protein